MNNQNVNTDDTTSEIITMPAQPLARNTPGDLMRLAVERGMGPDELGKLLELQERHEHNEAARAFAVAMTDFQRRCPSIKKLRTADFGEGKTKYKFASLDDIMEVIAPVMSDVGINVGFDVEQTDQAGSITVVTILRKGIHEQRTRFTAPVPENVKVNKTQQYGMALSYLKRYGLCAALNITLTDQDNDGHGMGESAPEPITEEQAIQLADMLETLGPEVTPLFFKWINQVCKTDVKAVKDIPAKSFDEAFKKLKAKLDAKGKP